MKEIKLTIDGKEVALTDEQIKALGIDVDDGCVCDRANDGCWFYYVRSDGIVDRDIERDWQTDKDMFECGNYYRSESYAEQVALHQHLNNLLRRYSEQHGGDPEWDAVNNHFLINFDFSVKTFYVNAFSCSKQCGVVHFGSQSVAEKALEEVVKPFMEEHPEFVW